MLCDWLPPDFGAVGQYAVGFADALAMQGHDVHLVGFSSTGTRRERSSVGSGSVETSRLRVGQYDRSNLLGRALWTLAANARLLWHARGALLACDEIRFTGSPPYLLHFVMPLATLLGKSTRYRITDFHPECLIASRGRSSLPLRLVQAMTNWWRRRVDVIEVIGEDQARRLRQSGVRGDAIQLHRDPSPVNFEGGFVPAQKPDVLAGRPAVLYSGNWGVAHDVDTWVLGMSRFVSGPGPTVGMWLNATGAASAAVREGLVGNGVVVAHTAPVPLAQLAGVLAAADLHLITLKDAFVGYVLPSKVYACIASRQPILFIGSADSDVHLLCSALASDMYRRVDVGDVDGVVRALEHFFPGPHGPDKPVTAQHREQLI